MPHGCPNCSSENPDQARYCGQCGYPLPPIDVPVSAVPLSEKASDGPARLDSPERLSEYPQTPPARWELHTSGFPASGFPTSEDTKNQGWLAASTHLSGGRYTIERLVATSGMGAVYRALDTRFNRPCAIKEMVDAFQTETERRQAEEWFEREALLLLELNHPCIPRVRDFFIEANRHYLVMDFIEGRTLSEVLEKEGDVQGLNGASGVSEAQARSWGQQLCSVLSYLHQLTPPILFRDLKPSNIMVTAREEIKLIDFGIARTFQSQRQSPILMTIGYAPPEQLHGMPEPRSDIYALGATLHRVLTGQDAAHNTPTIFSFPPVRLLRPDISPAFEAIITKALNPALDQRWHDAREMERAIINLPPIIPVNLSAPPTGAASKDATLSGWREHPLPTPAGSGHPMTPPLPQGHPGNPVTPPVGRPQQNTPPEPPQQGGHPYPAMAPGQAKRPYPIPFPPPSSSPPSPGARSPHASRGFRSSIFSRFSKPDSALERMLSARGKPKEPEAQLSLFAIARAILEEDNQAIVGKLYTALVGIAQSVPERFQGAPFDVPVRDMTEPLWFDIVVHPSENIELAQGWHKPLRYDLRNPHSQLVECVFHLRAPGQSSLAITFYHERRWLQTLRLEFEGVETSTVTTVESGGCYGC